MLLDFLLCRKQYSGSSTVAAPFYIRTSNAQEFHFLHTHTNICCFLVSFNSHRNECEMPADNLGGRACQHNLTRHVLPRLFNAAVRECPSNPPQASTTSTSGTIPALRSQVQMTAQHSLIPSQVPLAPERQALPVPHIMSLMTSLRP